ncbi:uncharacterized protein LOC116161298 [Photinus pyralis]|nr:uncharacterized protein LOC116161298 [Photinus pyralis]
MKSLFVIVFLLGGGALAKYFPQEILDIWNKIADPYSTECALQAGVTKDYVREELLKGSVPDSLQFKNYFVCIYEHLELFDTDGEFSKQRIHKLVPYMSVPFTEVCVTESKKGRDRLEKSYLMLGCVVNGLSNDD